jgi:HSP20 family protein
MTLVKFNKPAQNGFNQLVDGFFNDFPALFNENFNNYPRKGFVPVNVKESKDAYQLEVVAPGFEKNDFRINIENDLLTVSAEKKSEVKEENEKQVRKEYSYQSFKRSFTLDEKIDASKIDAKYVNGVLSLNLPKKAEVKEAAKEITIQ